MEKPQINAKSKTDNSINSNNNILITGESSLKKLQKSIKNNKNLGQEKYLQDHDFEQGSEKKLTVNERNNEISHNKSDNMNKQVEIIVQKELKNKTPGNDFLNENFESNCDENSNKIQNFTIEFKTNDIKLDNIEKTCQTEIYLKCDEEKDDKSNNKQRQQPQSEPKIEVEFNEECFEGIEDQEESAFAIYEYPNEVDVKL